MIVYLILISVYDNNKYDNNNDDNNNDDNNNDENKKEDDSNDKLHLCVLKEYKKKDIKIGAVQILINLLYDKFDIEIYKFDNMKQYKDFENTLIIQKRKKKL